MKKSQIVLESEIFFNKTVELDKEFIFSLTSSSFPNKWNDFFYENNNVNANFAYSDKNELIFQSSKLSRKKMNSNILFDRNLLLSSDSQGNIILYSLEKKKFYTNTIFIKKNIISLKKNFIIFLKTVFYTFLIISVIFMYITILKIILFGQKNLMPLLDLT